MPLPARHSTTQSHLWSACPIFQKLHEFDQNAIDKWHSFSYSVWAIMGNKNRRGTTVPVSTPWRNFLFAFASI